jgi:hypothetical protein
VAEGYSCKHCKKPFSNERYFMRHECTPMVRAREILTIEGRQSYELYKIWLEKQKRKAPPIETFCTSSYYTSFFKFAIWIRETGVPSPEKYVELMVQSKIAPALWRRSEAYQIYLEWNDRKSSPIDQAAITVDTITALAEGLQCTASDVFTHFKIGEILELIQQRRLSPWLLFCSKSFKQWVNTLDTGDRQMLMKGIGIDFWAGKLERSPNIVKDLRELAESLGI